MKNKIILIAATSVCAGLCVIVFLYHYISRGRVTLPSAKLTGEAKEAKQGHKTSLLSPAEKTEAPIEKETSAKIIPLSEDRPGLAPDGKKEQRKLREPEKILRLKAKPEEISIKAKQGQKGTAELELINTGKQEELINIYKSEPEPSQNKVEERINDILRYRKTALPEKPQEKDLKNAALFSGASWLIPFPYYAAIKAGESIGIQLTADAGELPDGEQRVDLIIFGASADNPLVIPIYVEVEKAPKIKVSQVTIDDGFSPFTRGNKNRVAEPGEKVAFSVSLKNEGNGFAKDLKLEINSHDPNLQILDSKTAQIPYLDAQGETQISFITEVSPASNPDIPAVVTVITVDNEGTQWSDNFYLGEQEQIKYPLGLLSNKRSLIEQGEENE